MEMTKKMELTEALYEKIRELEAIKERLYKLANNVEVQKTEHNAEIEALESELEQVYGEQLKATTLDDAQKLLKKANSLKEQIELLQGVKQAVNKNSLGDVSDSVEHLFSIHRQATQMYKELEQEFKADVSLSSLEADNNSIQDIASNINNASRIAKNMLIDLGIITWADKFFEGKKNRVNLNPRELYTDLKFIFTPDSRRDYIRGI